MNDIKEKSSRISNADMIKNILTHKKELESFEKRIYKKHRHRLTRLNNNSKQNRSSFSTTPDIYHKRDLTLTKELKIPKHILSEECGLNDPISLHSDFFVMSVNIKKLPKQIKNSNKNEKVEFMAKP